MRRFLRIIYNLLNPGMFAALLVLAGRYRGFSALWPQAPAWVDATLVIAVCAWLVLIYRRLFNRAAGRDRRTGAAAIFSPGTRLFQTALLLLGLLFLAGIAWSADPEYGLHKATYFLDVYKRQKESGARRAAFQFPRITRPPRTGRFCFPKEDHTPSPSG